MFLMLLGAVALTASAAASSPSSFGCYKDGSQNGNTRLFQHSLPNLQSNNATPAACAAACLKAYPSATLAGIEDGTQCFCGTYGAEVKAARGPDSGCSLACSPAGAGKCGGNWWLSVYWISGAPPPPEPPIPGPPPVSTPAQLDLQRRFSERDCLRTTAAAAADPRLSERPALPAAVIQKSSF